MQGIGARYLLAAAIAVSVTTGSLAQADEPYRPTPPERWIPATDAKPKYRRAAAAPLSARSPQRSWPTEPKAYSGVVAEAAAQYAVPERLIWAVIRVESKFDHRAVSPKGARGLMQLMPQTAKMLGIRNVFDPRENIKGGTRHLRAMIERFPYDMHLAVAAYNAGEKAVLDYRGVPPFPETRDYVIRVLQLYATPVDCCQSQGGDIQRIQDISGSVTYTNMPFTRISSAR